MRFSRPPSHGGRDDAARYARSWPDYRGSFVCRRQLHFVTYARYHSSNAEVIRLAFHPAGGWLFPFRAYATANVVWISPVPWLGWKDWLGWAQMVAVFWVVLNDVRAKPTRALLFGGLVAVGWRAGRLGGGLTFPGPFASGGRVEPTADGSGCAGGVAGKCARMSESCR